MNKKYGKIILALIMAFQLAVPFTMFIVKSSRVKALDENGIEIKIKLDTIYTDEKNKLYLCSDVLREANYYNGYTIFETDENGFSKIVYSDTKPENGFYIKNLGSGYYDWGSLKYENKEISDITDSYVTYYDAKQEESNIRYGYCQGSVTEAYMTILIYKGEYRVTGVFVNGVSFEKYIEMCKNNEFDLSRFEWQYDYEEDYIEDW